MAGDPRALLDTLSGAVPPWLEAPEWDDEGIALSTRVRLARNLDGIPFPHHADLSEREEVIRRVEGALSGASFHFGIEPLAVEELLDPDRAFLVERRLLTPAMAAGTGPRQLHLDGNERVSMMVHEEDHLRYQVVTGGMSVADAWSRLEPLDEALGERLPFAFSEETGYLTASPANVGTGLRVEVLLHLPALVLTEEAESVLRSAASGGMLVHGLHGEGTSVFGNLFQLANRQTLGRSIADILASVQRVAREVTDHEREARATLLKEARLQVEDRIHRALAILGSARVLSEQECLNLLSAVRLGVNMYVLSDVRINTLNALMIQIRHSHLERREGRRLSPGEEDVLRAHLVRVSLSVAGGGTEPHE